MIGIYFSGTGNSRYAVEFFCNEYGEAAKAFSIEGDNVLEAIKSDEMLVFAYPVQYSTVPKILRDFIIENKELWENKKVFVIATMGLFSGDGVTIAEFDADMQICDLKEFQSKAEHYCPYGE